MISSDLQAIVVSHDPSVLNMLPSLLRNIGVRPIVQRDAAAVLQTARRQRLDAVFVDSDLDPDCSLLREIRTMPGGRKLIVMAMISRPASIREAFRFSDFILEKPFLHKRVSQTLRAAHGMMVRSRLQYTRLPLDTEASVFNDRAKNFIAQATNVSTTGIALASTAPFLSGETVQIQFRLPEILKALSCKARVIWTDSHSKAGFSFVEMRNSDREQLSSWIETQFIESFQRSVLTAPPALLAPATQSLASNRA